MEDPDGENCYRWVFAFSISIAFAVTKPKGRSNRSARKRKSLNGSAAVKQISNQKLDCD